MTRIKRIYTDFCYKTINADITVNGIIILELKACKKLNKKHELQLKNYLKASSIELGFLLNFGQKPEFRRIVFSNHQTT